jgi:hypothetical protein
MEIFPHKERDLIGGVVDIDPLSIFRQKDSKIIEGTKRKSEIFKINNGRERMRDEELCGKEEEEINRRHKNIYWGKKLSDS